MELIFIILFILYILAEIYMISRFIMNKNKTYLNASVLSIGLFLLFLLAVVIFHWDIPYYALLFVMLELFLDTFVGFYLDFFNKHRPFDRCLHAYGTFAFAILLYWVLINLTQPGGSVFFRAVFVASLGVVRGAVIEVFEFVVDSKCKTCMQKDLVDTDFDIIFDIIGSIAAAVFACVVFL